MPEVSQQDIAEMWYRRYQELWGAYERLLLNFTPTGKERHMSASTITVNGEEYVLKSDVNAAYEDSEHVCVICTHGWIFEGRKVGEEGGDLLLSEAHVVRKWSNGLGIGGIALPGHFRDYTLDACGSVRIHGQAVISVISIPPLS